MSFPPQGGGQSGVAQTLNIQKLPPKYLHLEFSKSKSFNPIPYTGSDTTTVSTTSTTRVNLKTYTYNTAGGATPRKIRVRVYAYVSAGTGTVYLNIDNIDVASATVTATASTLVIDYIGDIGAGAHTVKVDGLINASTNTLYVSAVYIIDSYVLTPTNTSTPAVSFSSPADFVILKNGDFDYNPVVIVQITFYRKVVSATITATVSGALSSGSDSKSYSNIDDGDNVGGVIDLLYPDLFKSPDTPSSLSIAATASLGTNDIIWVLRVNYSPFICNLYIQRVVERYNKTANLCIACYETGTIYLSYSFGAGYADTTLVAGVPVKDQNTIIAAYTSPTGYGVSAANVKIDNPALSLVIGFRGGRDATTSFIRIVVQPY